MIQCPALTELQTFLTHFEIPYPIQGTVQDTRERLNRERQSLTQQLHQETPLNSILGDYALDGLPYGQHSRQAMEKRLETVQHELSAIDARIEKLMQAENLATQFHQPLQTLIAMAEQAAPWIATYEQYCDRLRYGNEKALFAAHADYQRMTDTEIAARYDSDGANALAAITENMDTLRAIQQYAEQLTTAKGGNADEVRRVRTSSINELITMLNAHRPDGGFNHIIQRQNIYTEATAHGLGVLLHELERHLATMDTTTSTDTITDMARAAIIDHVKRTVDQHYGLDLMNFDGASLDAARKRFQALDKKLVELSHKEVAAHTKDKATPPPGVGLGASSQYTELSLLYHQLALKKRRKAPRQILKRARRALLELFPCWMMTPTAVAEHLPREAVFDLVIIDEASQMEPQDGISALMRGRHVMIAGDTNQLPPTNFFNITSDDDEGDKENDHNIPEESILELANSKFSPKHQLKWHYRSKHEDLIKFSNHYVYDSDLVIFPSPTPAKEGLGVHLVPVENATFEQGINETEASVMLEHITRFMAERPDKSLGVVVMNNKQAELLESMLEEAAQNNQAIDKYRNHWEGENAGLQKFFIKNLENVQGDERDVIFIGTVYGPNTAGQFRQQLGPINGPAGKRRLNVLFSRAKEQIMTFSSIPADQFNPRSENEGATMLKNWLIFSVNGQLGEADPNHARKGQTDSPFEDHVIEVVRSLGYEAIPQIGIKPYFIDIGVEHADYPHGYICGIECDGATYHSSKSARDRDRIREDVLNGLGWTLYRIWSTDWFRDTAECTATLKAYLDARLVELKADIRPPVAPTNPENTSS